MSRHAFGPEHAGGAAIIDLSDRRTRRTEPLEDRSVDPVGPDPSPERRPPSADPRPRGAGLRASRLRSVLIGLDLGVAAATWVIVLAVADAGRWAVPRTVGMGLALGLVTVAIMASQRLYLARACAVRAAEIAGVVRTSAWCATAVAVVHLTVNGRPSIAVGLIGSACAGTVIIGTRGLYASWLKACRARGMFARPVCVLGTNDEAEGLVQLLMDQPEIGYRVVAAVGDPDDWSNRQLDVPAVVPAGDIGETVRALGASGVVIAVTAVPSDELDHLVRRLGATGLHVQISSGLTRVGHRRLRVSPMSHQLLFYVEPPQLSRWQSLLKRAMDITIASVGLLLTAPVLVVAALAIKLDDGGPIIFRQERVGRNGRPFGVLKLRSMVPGASRRVADLAALNERNGPLFKVTRDPRVTRVGRLLRASSIDELPQLFNVLRGEMSIVGPRPALPSEVEQFDAELRQRASVPPGVTGLWQVEAGESPSFRAYRRLDLFYVDNWSVAMDLAIMASTLTVVIGRALRTLRKPPEAADRADQPSVAPRAALVPTPAPANNR